MITKQELRIGNYVCRGLSDETRIVEAITGQGVYLINAFAATLFEDIKPIPITEEWLLKLGFGKCEEHTLSKDISERLEVVYDWHFKILYLMISSPHSEEQAALTHIEHVHELQNFWYSLTTEELTIIDFLAEKV